RYRRQAEERYRRLDAVLAAMDDAGQESGTHSGPGPHSTEEQPTTVGRNRIMTTVTETTIEADPKVPIIRMTRD
ncbi:hypothetical protein, partial [Burkholderia multivorans]|uniref:hypothetical protein n=1 Tax=Burkholderia multivorans TaxID=87883 RepID=UPI0021AC3F2F